MAESAQTATVIIDPEETFGAPEHGIAKKTAAAIPLTAFRERPLAFTLIDARHRPWPAPFGQPARA